MTRYTVPLGTRFAQGFQDVQRRVRTLEARSMGIDSGFPLMALTGFIDPAYSSGDPMVLINGATVLSGPYSHLSSYTPAANDQVLVIPVVSQQTYIVIGKLV